MQSLTVPQPIDNVGPSAEHQAPGVLATSRYVQSAPLHTVIVVEMPPLVDVIKALEEDALPANTDVTGNDQQPLSTNDSAPDGQQPPHSSDAGVPPPSIAGRSLPLLFIRASDGIGYHSGRTIACENVFQTMELTLPGSPANPDGWLAATQTAGTNELHGWTLRVM